MPRIGKIKQKTYEALLTEAREYGFDAVSTFLEWKYGGKDLQDLGDVGVDSDGRLYRLMSKSVPTLTETNIDGLKKNILEIYALFPLDHNDSNWVTGLGEDDHHSRSHDHSVAGDSTTLNPDLINFLNASNVALGLIKIDTGNQLSIEAVSPATTIYLRTATGTDDRFRFQTYDGGANNKGRIQWHHNSGTSNFYTKEYYDTIYAALSDYNTHVADADAHHNEDHTHGGDAINPSSLWGIVGAAGVIGGATGYLSSLVFGVASSLAAIDSDTLRLTGMDLEIYDGKKMILFDADESNYVEQWHDGTYWTLKFDGATTVASVSSSVWIDRVSKYMYYGAVTRWYSSDLSKYVSIYHDNTNATILVPSGDGSLYTSIAGASRFYIGSTEAATLGGVALKTYSDGNDKSGYIKHDDTNWLLRAINGEFRAAFNNNARFYTGDFATEIFTIKSDGAIQLAKSLHNPGSPEAGDIWYDATDRKFYVERDDGAGGTETKEIAFV